MPEVRAWRQTSVILGTSGGPRMVSWRNLGVLIGFCVTAPAALAQTQTLTDPPKTGDCTRYDLSLSLKGEIRVARDGKTVSMPITATATHQFAERILES